MTTFVLRDMVEAFPASDGAIYFLSGGTRAEHVLEEASDLDRRVLELLHVPRTRAELIRAPTEADDVDALLAELDQLGLLETQDGAPAPAGLSEEAAERYDRQLAYFARARGADGQEAQRRLLDATVAIVGCGGLGTWTAAGLACAGVGRLVLVDDDSVELSNLNRQLLFRRSDVGRPKVEAARDALEAFDPGIEIRPIRQRVTGVADVERVAAGADVIVAVADDPPYAIERWVNEVACAHGIAHVSASQFPPGIRVGPLVRPGITGCVNCQVLAARREFPEFDALVRYRQADRRVATALGPLAAMVGAVLSTDVTHLLAGVATPATEGCALMIDSRTLTVEREPVRREPGCEICSGLLAGRRRDRTASGSGHGWLPSADR